MNQIAESKVNEVVVNISKVTGDTPTVMKELSAKIRNIVAGDQKIMAMSPEVISESLNHSTAGSGGHSHETLI